METCTYGSEAGCRKPTTVRWHGADSRAYEMKMNNVWDVSISVSKSFLKNKLQMRLSVTPYTKPRVSEVIKSGLSYKREKLNDGTFIKLEVAYTISGGNLRQRRQAQSIQQYEKQENNY